MTSGLSSEREINWVDEAFSFNNPAPDGDRTGVMAERDERAKVDEEALSLTKTWRASGACRVPSFT